MLLEYRKQLRGKKGIILLNSALLAEANITHLCNNNILLVTANPEVKYERLLLRGYSKQEAAQRMDSQLSAQAKRDTIQDRIISDGCGCLIEFDNSVEDSSDKKYSELLMTIYGGFGFGRL